MIEVFDRNRRRVAILENAYAISEKQKINSLWYLYFSLPHDDTKRQYCQPFYYVRHDGGELYRIMPETLTVDETGGVAYQCEHVLATLIDNILFGYHVVGNIGYYTADVIRYILDHQLVKNWTLYECDFTNQFEYGWTQESLLSAFYSVLRPLSAPMIVTDTSVYPWRLSLKKLVSGRPQMYIRRRHNMTSLTRGSDPSQIVTRLYPLGYGEGVNQLGIASVNNGVPYLQSPASIVSKYGIIERVWVDRRYEDAESLKAAAEAMLAELQEPLVSYSIGFEELDTSDYDKAAIGKRARIIYPELGLEYDTYITEITRNYDDVERSTLAVKNKDTSIAATVADMGDRQRIEQTYAQGATQIYSQALQANSDASSGAVMDFFLPEEMRIVNKVLLKVRLSKFRAYSSATSTEDAKTQTTTTTDDQTRTSKGGGKTTRTTTSTDDQTRTSSSGGRTVTSTEAGGGEYTSTSTSAQQTATSDSVILSAENILPADASSNGAAVHNHGMALSAKLARYGGKTEDGTVIADGYEVFVASGAHSHGAHNHAITIRGHSHTVEIDSHSHRVTVPAHTHDLTIPGHSHSVTIPEHTHDLTIPGHSHKVTIPGHSHKITPGIYEFGNPTKGAVYINGTKRAEFSGRTAELDITSFLVSSGNMIPRGSWLSLEVRPDDLAYISIDLVIQGFIQSRGDKTV